MGDLDLRNLKLRGASFEDHEAILSITEDSTVPPDYLFTLHNIYLQNKDCNCYVADLNGEVVGYCTLLAMPEDEAIIKIGARVKHDKRRRGIFKKFKKQFLELIRLKYPNIKYYVYSAEPNCYIERKIKDPNWSSTLKRTRWELHLVIPFVSHLSREAPSSVSPQTYDNDKLTEILTSAHAFKNLFKEEYFEVDYNWEPAKFSHKNIRNMIRSHKVYCSLDSTGECASVSFGFAMLLKNATGYTIQYHSLSHDSQLFLSHVSVFLSYLGTICLGDRPLYLTILMPYEYGDLSDNILKMIGPEQGKFISKTKDLVIEEDLHNDLSLT